MSDEISLLPENLRGKEEELKKQPEPPKEEEHFKMYVPKAEEEDVEVIEVDEGEVGEVLEGEPFLTRLIFRAQVLFDEAKTKLFYPQQLEPPPKLPPQFFKAPEAGSKRPHPIIEISKEGGVPSQAGKVVSSKEIETRFEASSKKQAVSSKETEPSHQPQATSSLPKARIMPSAKTPRRVRVIRRVRKPVRVSFIDEADIVVAINIPRRRFTLILVGIVFAILLGGSYALLDWQNGKAAENLSDLDRQLAEVRTRTQESQRRWETYSDLEPRLMSLSSLLDRHLSPSKVFDALEFYTVPDVYYTSFTLSPDARVVLTAAASSFQSAARQIVSFERSGIAYAVQAAGYQASYDSFGRLENVTFQISLTLDPKVLKAAEPLALTP